MATMNNYDLLIQKLDQFIRKYYVNQLIRGSLYSVGLIVVLFLGFNLVEHFFYLPMGGRKLLFFSFLGISAGALGVWVAAPLVKYFKLGQTISHEQAAQIIGSHFADVKDKLLNILQLRQQAEGAAQKDLILASINQKSEEIKPVPFQAAINLGQNRRYLRYALPPLLLLLTILLAAPSIISESTKRLIRNGEDFERPAPFRFVVDEQALSVVQFGDFPLTVEIEGDVLPKDVFIDIDNYQYRLTKEAPGRYSYRFSNVQKDAKFKLFSGDIYSKGYTLDVLEKPNIVGFEVKLAYPAYIGRSNETLSSIGDLVVPAGTRIDWVFNAQSTDDISLQFSGEGKRVPAKRFSDELFTFDKRAMRDEAYKLFISNKNLPNGDSVGYTISVIPDLHPTIGVEKFQDSTDRKLLFFVGEAADDYGLRSLAFHYQVKRAKTQQPEKPATVAMKKPDGKQIRYDYTFDMELLNLTPGDEVTYYFEVYDNDGVNGSKAARTNVMMFSMPTVEEFQAMAEKNSDQIKQELKSALDESKKIQQDLKKMREKLLQEKEVDWRTRKEIEKMLDRQEQLQKQIEDAKDAFQENLENQKEFAKQDERIMEKQEKLQQLFEEMLSEEMKELMKQIEDLLEQLDKDKALEKMEEMAVSDEQLEKELDRMMELYKQLEMEQQMQETIDELRELAEEQEKLSEETEEGKTPNEELKKEQEEINEKFDKLEEKMEEMKEKNEELEDKKDLEKYDEQMEGIEEDLEDSKEQLDQKKSSKAAKSQKNASQKMKNMAGAMEMDMQAGEQEQMEEDLAALRQLLENLLRISFDQEGLMKSFGEATINTPKYVSLVQEQFKLKDDFRIVEDSLHALSKRVYQIESFVTEKVADIKGNMRQSLEELEERRVPQASGQQQRGMKNLNDLALMLSEVMDQMQQQMASSMPGDQMCNKPGSGKSGKKGSKPSDQMGEGQKGLNEQMKGMRDRMKNGDKGNSKEFAQMAAKQAALRDALRKKQQELQQRGKGDKQLDELMDMMDKSETELVNKKLTNETMKRQEDILTRLLEHEKAEREREYEEKRKADVAEQRQRTVPPSLEEYIKKREAEVEMYKTVSPSLKPYYKNLVQEYFKALEGK